MTLREAVVQALLEIGMSREEAELRSKLSDAFLPDAAALTQSPVKPGLEREFIDVLKQTFRQRDANPEAVLAHLRSEIAKRAKAN